jgi:hypothetical protein
MLSHQLSLGSRLISLVSLRGKAMRPLQSAVGRPGAIDISDREHAADHTTRASTAAAAIPEVANLIRVADIDDARIHAKLRRRKRWRSKGLEMNNCKSQSDLIGSNQAAEVVVRKDGDGNRAYLAPDAAIAFQKKQSRRGLERYGSADSVKANLITRSNEQSDSATSPLASVSAADER